MLALTPVVLARDTLNNFEFPKTVLLLIAALALVAWWIAGEVTSAATEGPFGWARSLPRRAWASARSDPAGAAVILFLISAVASTVASINPTLSLHGAADSYAGVPIALATASIYFASRGQASDARWLRRVAVAAAIGAGAASVYGLLQLLNLDPMPWGETASFGKEVRIFGTLGHPNILGAYLVMALPLIVWLWSNSSSRLAQIALSSLLASSLATIIATLSRGAWMAMAAAGIAWGVLSWRAARAKKAQAAEIVAGAAVVPGSRRIAAAAGAILLCLALLAPAISSLGPNLAHRIREIGAMSSPTARSRFEIWRAGLRMAADHPLLGVGVDAFAAAFPRYRTPEYWAIEWGGTPTKAHNEAIQILATQGIFGGTAALLVVALVIRAVWRSAGVPHPATRRGAIAVGAALAGFAVQDFPSFTTAATGTLAAALAGWAAQSAISPPGDPTARSERRPAAERSAVGLFAGSAVAVALFVPLALLPWLAEHSAYNALSHFLSSPEREQGLRRAERLTPWDARYPSKLGTGFLVQALREPDPYRRWVLLGKARESLERMLRILPESSFERSSLGHGIAMQSRLRPEVVSLNRAREAFAEARHRDPANAIILLQEEETYLEMGRDDIAREPALQAAALYPDFGKPLADLGVIALRAGRNEGAADTLRLAVTKNFHGDDAASAEAWDNLAAAYANLGRYEESLRAAERALDLAPGRAVAVRSRDAALQALGRPR